jgi:hypothetical protein
MTFDKYLLIPTTQFSTRAFSSMLDAGITLLHDVEHVLRSRQKCTALLIGLSTVLITRFYLMAFPCSFCTNQKLQITRYILLSYYPLTSLTKQWLDHHSLQKYAPPEDPVFDLVPHAFAMCAIAVWTDMGSPEPQFSNAWDISYTSVMCSTLCSTAWLGMGLFGSVFLLTPNLSIIQKELSQAR